MRSDKQENTCAFCATVNWDTASTCTACGRFLHKETVEESMEVNGKKSRFRFLISRIGAVDFLNLNLPG